MLTSDGEDLGATLERLEGLIAARAEQAAAVELTSLHFTAAQMYLCQPGAEARKLALEHLWAGWRLQPQDMDVRLVLARCLEEEAKLTDLAELYQRSAEHSEDMQEQNALLARAADIFQRRGDLEEALNIFQRMAEYGGHRLVEERVRALRALIRTLGGDRADLRIKALALLLGHLRGNERFDCAMELAQAERLAGDEDAAYAAYQQALALRPDAECALEPAVEYLERRGQLGDMVRLLSLAMQASEHPAHRADLLRRLARLFEERLSDPAQAVELWRHAWDEAGTGGDLAALKRLYASQRQWDGYLEVLRQEVQRARTVAEKLASLRELATFQLEVLHDPREAAETHGFILQLQPDDCDSLAARVALYEGQGMELAAAAALRRLADRTQEPGQRSELLRRLARLEMRRPGRGNLLRVLLRLDSDRPEDRALVGELRMQLVPEREKHLLVQTGLLQLSMARQAGEAPASWVEIALELCRYCLRVGEHGHAADCLRQILEADPNHAAALELQRQLAPRDSSSDPGPDELAARAEALAMERPLHSVRLLIQAAEVARDRLLGEDGCRRAGDLLHTAVSLCPLDADAELLSLEDALRSAELDEDLAALLQRRAESEVVPGTRKALLLALAHLLRDRLRQPDRAVMVLEEALALDHLDTQVAEEIRALHTQLGNHAALTRVLEELLAAASELARVPILEELGRLYAEVLHDSKLALDRYSELLTLCPHHYIALSYCRSHAEAAGNFRTVAVLLCRAAETAGEAIEQAELHREIALIAEEKLADLDFAIAQWRRVVELCPADLLPRRQLRRLLGRARRWSELESLLLSDVSRMVRPEEKVPLYLELATLAREHLHDERQAAGYLRLAQQISPASRELLVQLEAVYERLGQWRELASTLRRHTEVETDSSERLKLLHRTARVLQVRLKREDEALEICRQVRQLQPGDRSAATLMSEIFSRRAQWTDKAALLREQVALETDPTELTRLHLELGHLLAEKMTDPQTATQHFERAMELDGARGDVLHSLRRFYESQGRWDQLVELIRRRASAENLPARERAMALCEIGRIYELHQANPDAARDAYERALHLDGACQAALTGLRLLAAKRGQWREVVSLSRRQLELCTDNSARSALLLELGEVLHEKLGRSSAAAEALEEVLASEPGNLGAAARLAAISFEAEDWERAARLLKQVVESDVEPENLHECYYRLGFATEKLGDEEAAFSFYVKSFGREPMYLPTLDRLVELCYARRQWDNTLRIASAIVDTYQDRKNPAQLAALHLRIGLCELQLAERDIAVAKLQDMVLEPGEVPGAPDEAWLDVAESWAATALNPHLLGRVPADTMSRAVRSMERTLAKVPEHVDALQVLAALSLSIGEWERALRYIERVVATASLEPRCSAALLCCAGDVTQHCLSARERAESYYRQALGIDPSHGRTMQHLGRLLDHAQAGAQPRVPDRALRSVPPPVPGPTLRPPRPPFRPAPRSKPRKPGGEE